MKMSSTLAVVTASIVISCAVVGDCRAAFRDATSLKGIEAVCVKVTVNKVLDKAGMETVPLQDKVEALLRRGGIKLIPHDEWIKSITAERVPPRLTVTIDAIEGNNNGFVYMMQVTLSDSVTLRRTGEHNFTPVWQVSEWGTIPKSKLNDFALGLADMTDAFLNDFAKANPEKK
jgi:hypothetical protein